MTKTIKVLIAEDHAVVRQGLNILISQDSSMKVAGEAGTGEEAVLLTEKIKPDVVIMDVAMPKLNGIQATAEIVRRHPAIKVLVLSSYFDEDTVRAMMKAGASGYVTKHSASADLLQAIREVSRGYSYFSPVIV